MTFSDLVLVSARMSTRTVALVALLGVLAAPAAHAQPAAPPLPKVNRWKLANGLEVAHIQVERAPVVAVQVWYRGGSAVEPKGKHGLARLHELLMSRGSTHVRPEMHARYVEQVGGFSRASTLEDAAGYHALVPPAYLDLALRLEADRMRGLEWRQSELDAVRKQLAAEAQQVAADPSKQLVWRTNELIYGTHGYAHEPLGDRLDLDAVTLDDLKKFHTTYRVPNNALLVVAGAVDQAAVKAAVDRWMAPVPRGADPPKLAPPAGKPAAQRKQLAAGPVGLVFHGWRIPEARHADIYALQVASLILGVGRGARVYSELVDTRRMAIDAGASAILRTEPGVFMVYASFAEPALAKPVEGALAAQVAELAKAPPSAAEMERARNLVLADFVPRLETATGLANQTGLSWMLTGDPGLYLRDLAALQAVTAADVQRVVAAHLGKDSRITVVMPPEAPR